jgi:hypothetical protein
MINPDSSLLFPREEAEKSLEQAVEARIAPLAEAVARLEAKLDNSLKNAKLLMTADASGTKGQSAQAQSRKRPHPKIIGKDGDTQKGKHPRLMASSGLQKMPKKVKNQQRENGSNQKAGPTQVNTGNYQPPPPGQTTPPGDLARGNWTGGNKGKAKVARWNSRKNKGKVDRQ